MRDELGACLELRGDPRSAIVFEPEMGEAGSADQDQACPDCARDASRCHGLHALEIWTTRILPESRAAQVSGSVPPGSGQ
jgi:hypothetical protein